MKIRDIIIEQGVGRELYRRFTMRPEQKQELEQIESMLTRLTKQPLAQVQKNSKDILKKYKEFLNQNYDVEKDPVDRSLAFAKAIEPYYPEYSKKIVNAYNLEKAQPTQQQTARSYKTDVPYQLGYLTAVILPTGGGDRRFWFNGRNWLEHTGSNWPKDLETSQKVTDPNIVQAIAQQVKLKNTTQIPYGQRPKRSKNKKKS